MAWPLGFARTKEIAASCGWPANPEMPSHARACRNHERLQPIGNHLMVIILGALPFHKGPEQSLLLVDLRHRGGDRRHDARRTAMGLDDPLRPGPLRRQSQAMPGTGRGADASWKRQQQRT
jgi:hypothetical protein